MESFSNFLKHNSENLSENRGLDSLMETISNCIVTLSYEINQGPILGNLGNLSTQNVQGEIQKKLDVRADEIFSLALSDEKNVIAFVSEEKEKPTFINKELEKGYVVFFDPLDGSSNVDVNGIVGSIFSVYQITNALQLETLDLLLPGSQQVAAGYSTFGPSTMLVVAFNNLVNGFTFESSRREFVLTHKNLQVSEDYSEYSINSSNLRYWEPPIQKYIKECNEGEDGVREKNFNMRWCGSMVADIHRILLRGGVFLYPKDNKVPEREGRLRLMYEANPMAMIVENAGGQASTGRVNILNVIPDGCHQRIPVIIGAAKEVKRIETYYQKYDGGSLEYDSPLFRERSLFVDPK